MIKKILFTLAAIVATIIAFAFTANAEIVIDNTIRYTVLEGTVYWETSEQYGSGNHNTVCEENKYTDLSCGELPVWIDGYSKLNSNGDIVEWRFTKKVKILSVPTTSSETLMVHIWGADGGYRLGWVAFDEIRRSKPSSGGYTTSRIPAGKEEEWFENSIEKTVENTAETLKKEVEEDSKKPRQSYILADFSGSMAEFQTDVLKKIQSAGSCEKYVFAEEIKKFNDQENPWEYNIGGATDIANALNAVASEGNSHIYILSDLDDNCGTEIEKNENFIGEITIVYYPSSYSSAVYFMGKLREAYPKATITGF